MEKGVGYRKGGPHRPGEAGEWYEKGASKVSVAFTSPEAGSWGSVCLPAVSPGQPMESPWLLATPTLWSRAEIFSRLSPSTGEVLLGRTRDWPGSEK